MASYYAARARRDPDWRQAQIAAAAERYRRALAADPEHVRDWSRGYRTKLREHALTITQLRERAAVAHSDADRETLARVLRQEVAAGRVELVQGRYYRLNGALPADVVAALRGLAPVEAAEVSAIAASLPDWRLIGPGSTVFGARFADSI